MAGTTFVDGTIVTPAFLNAIPKENLGAINSTDLADIAVGSFAAALDGAGFVGGDIAFTVKYLKVGSLVIVAFPSVLSGTSDANTMQIKMTNMPAALGMDNGFTIPFTVFDGGNIKTGLLLGDVAVGNPWVVQCPVADQLFSASGFATSGSKGIWAQTICYHTDLS